MIYRMAFCLMLWPFMLLGQSVTPPLEFDATSFDFGSIRAEDGSVFHTFHYANHSSRTVNFGRISPSCDCVSAINTLESAEPGAMGEITLRFSPVGASGRTHRYVEIFEHGGNLLTTLNVSADVIPEEVPIDIRYRYHITDKVLVDRKQLDVGYIVLGEKATGAFSIINTSKEAVSLHLTTAPANLTARAPESLAPGEEAAVEILFSVPNSPESYGVRKGTVGIKVEEAQKPFELTVSYIVIDEFEDNATAAPSLIATPSLVPLRKKLFSSNYEGTFSIENRGNVDLHFRSVETQNEVTIDIGRGYTIKPGEKKKVTANSSKDVFSVFFITDDPKRPMKEIRFKYEKE